MSLGQINYSIYYLVYGFFFQFRLSSNKLSLLQKFLVKVKNHYYWVSIWRQENISLKKVNSVISFNLIFHMLSDVISKVLNYFISMIKFLTMAFMLICSICVPQVGIGMSSFPNNELESDAKLYHQRSVKGIDRRSDAFIVID